MVFNLLEFLINFRVYINVFIKDTRSLIIILPLSNRSLLDNIINVISYSVNSEFVLELRIFLLLEDEVIVLAKRYRALLKFSNIVLSGLLFK